MLFVPGCLVIRQNTTRRLTFPSASSLLWTRIDLHATRSFQVLGFLPVLFLVVAGTMKAFHWLSFAVRTLIQLRPDQSTRTRRKTVKRKKSLLAATSPRWSSDPCG
ncbi:hypothetical protein HDV62DRAFT_98751 [Trichoderma sp. SZMC 28011]